MARSTVYHSVAPPTSTVTVIVTIGSAMLSQPVLPAATVMAVPIAALTSTIAVILTMFIMPYAVLVAENTTSTVPIRLPPDAAS